MFRSLLVPLDGAPFGEHALPLALAVAQRTGARLHLARVRIPSLGAHDPSPEGEAREQQLLHAEQSYLEEVARRLKQLAPTVEVQIRIVRSTGTVSVVSALLDCAQDVQADLFVLSTHARTGLARWWFGSVANELLGRTELPLLLVHGHEEPVHWEQTPALRHTLIPLDGSPNSETVLEAVQQMGFAADPICTLLRVVEPVSVPLADPTMLTTGVAEPALTEMQISTARQYLEGVSQRWQSTVSGVELRTLVVMDAQPGEAILSLVRSVTPSEKGTSPTLPIDLVALSTHQRGGLLRLLLGSTTSHVLHETPVPLLVQHAAETVA